MKTIPAPSLIFVIVGLMGLAATRAAGQSTRGGMGAVPYADAAGTGVTFRTWAPNASSVSVVGSFNGWGQTAMAPDASGGTWSIDVPRANNGDEYKFVVNGSWRKDPRGKRVVNSAGNSIVYDPAAFDWAGQSFGGIWRNDLVIYQMHVGSYNAESWLPSTFDQCLEKLDHIKAMGFSAIKLLPVNEFPGDRSWGYNPSDLFAVESSFGGPDGLKRFVKTCHENGIAVLLDVVHNHYGPSDLGDGMWQFDGWSQDGLGGIYFYNDWKAHTDWGSTRPDYGRGEVRTFIKDQIRMFLEEYRVDGFRWDSVYNIRHASGTWNQIGSDMLWDINQMMINDFPNAFRIAEDHAFDTDVGFEAQWDHAFLNDIRWLVTAGSDSDRNMDTLAYYLSNGGFNAVRYVESHDTCGDLNDKHRLPRDVDPGDPQGYWAKKRSLLGHGIALVSPGIPMVFAGSEMNEDWTFSNNTALRWSLTNQNAGIVRAFADLIHLRRNFAGLSGALKQPGNASVVHVNHDAKVVGVLRWDQGGGVDDLLIAVNASATARAGYEIPFPSEGAWYCLYNSDSLSYDASFGGVGPDIGGSIQVAGANGSLDLGAYSIQIYSKSRPSVGSVVQFDPPAPSGCGTPLTIAYSPLDGPLADAESVFAFIGRNDWMTATTLQMNASGDDWTLDYPIPDDTYEINLSFSDGADVWDNNGGANWRLPVADCGDLPSEVAWEPGLPRGCVPVQISYEANGGPLMGASNVFLFIGRNDWKDVAELQMDFQGGDLWSLSYDIPDDTWQLDFVFNDGEGNWDNNFSRDWHVIVADCLNVDQPFVAITNPAPATSVSSATTSLDLQGRASLLAGHLRWTNLLNGAEASIPCATNWTVASVPLAVGVNVVRVSGTNSAVNPNHGAADSPTNPAYASAWANGSTDGANLQPWIIGGGDGYAGTSTTNDSPGLSLGPRAWTLRAGDGAFIQAIRPFDAPLHAGDVVSFVFENGWVDGSPSSVGVAFQNRIDQRLSEFYFEGGSTNFVLNDLAWRNTGIPWSDGPKTCTFELLSSISYRLTVNGESFEGEFAEASEVLVSRIRFWNYNAGNAEEAKLFIGDLSIAGDPLPVQTYSSEIAVTRAPTGNLLIQAFNPSGSGFVATVSSASGIQSNVWIANALLSGGGWNWSLLPTDQYQVEGNVVTLAPVLEEGLHLISVGKPGGL
jgi:1,4-alpha-glucan branching enzyme